MALRSDADVSVSKFPNLEERVHAAIEEHAKDLLETEIKRAVVEYERRLRELVGKVAISVSGTYSIATLGQELVIRVNLGRGESDAHNPKL